MIFDKVPGNSRGSAFAQHNYNKWEELISNVATNKFEAKKQKEPMGQIRTKEIYIQQNKQLR